MNHITLSRRGMMGALAASAAAGALDLGAPELAFAQRPGMTGSRIQAALNAAYGAAKSDTQGKNADYIPALAQVPSTLFGIAIVTADGHVYEAGDSKYEFSIQSVSKPITAALVMQESGAKAIEDSVGVDSTGQVFNSITAVEQHRGKEMNPLVNPGAIATVGNVKGSSPDEVWNKILKLHSDLAGRKLSVNQPVYKSESDTNQRNRAISALMSAYERFPMDPAAAVDLYTRQCSINVSARDLATMAASMAFGGRNPVTKQQVLKPEIIPGVLAIMATAGMYDDTGKWLFHTGLPAKSGVGGGILAVVPGKFGIGTFAPPLDAAGNSIKGQLAIEKIVAELNANPYAQFS